MVTRQSVNATINSVHLHCLVIPFSSGNHKAVHFLLSGGENRVSFSHTKPETEHQADGGSEISH